MPTDRTATRPLLSVTRDSRCPTRGWGALRGTFLALAIGASVWSAAAQSIVTPGPGTPGHVPPPPHRPPPAFAPPPRVVVPQIGRPIGTATALAITGISARVTIDDRLATTTLDIALANRGGAAQEATLLVPVPAGAAVTGFAFEGPASEPTARVLGRDEARREYDAIVARERDPALLEWAGWSLVRSSVFPVPANGTQKVRLVWEELLSSQGDRLDYLLPRSDLAREGPAWQVQIAVSSSQPIGALYSPTHELTTISRNEKSALLAATERGIGAAGPLRLSIVRSAVPSATVVTYPDPTIGGGYYLLLGSAPVSAGSSSLRRDVVLVLDRSGSMAGAPLEQAKAAALRIVDSLADGERLNVVDFSNAVSRFAAEPVSLDARSRNEIREYIARLRPAGGTNLHDALLEALREPAAEGSLPLCLYVTDGLPTIGKTRERDIRALAENGNTHQRRIFTIGLGPDVNVPLLDRIADVSRAVATYVAASDDLGTKVSEIAERLRGPVLADPELRAEATTGAPSPGRIAESMPMVLPDLFRGSTLVALGQYRGEQPFRLVVEGRGVRGDLRLTADVNPREASVANAFVPRLWASRRIAFLVDELRQQGADAPGGTLPADDPRMRELVTEIVRLSTEFGILTEYTSMLALEGSNLHDWRALEVGCGGAIRDRAVQTRSGYSAVNQGINWNRQKLESNVAATRAIVDASLSKVEAQSLAQCADKNFYRNAGRWTDAAFAGEPLPQVDEEIEFGTPRHRQLLDELVAECRQSSIALDGEVLLRHHGKVLLVRNGAAAANRP